MGWAKRISKGFLAALKEFIKENEGRAEELKD